MSSTFDGAGGLAMVFGVITFIVGMLTTIFWLVVGWRAMRAHEQIAEVLRERLGADAPPPNGP